MTTDALPILAVIGKPPLVESPLTLMWRCSPDWCNRLALHGACSGIIGLWRNY